MVSFQQLNLYDWKQEETTGLAWFDDKNPYQDL